MVLKRRVRQCRVLRSLLTPKITVEATLVRLADQDMPPPVLSEPDCKAIRQADIKSRKYRTARAVYESVRSV
jgi:hypothetical protein